MLFKEWSLKWLAIYKKQNEQRTKIFYRDLIKNHINPYIGNLKLKDIKQVHILELLNKLDDKGLTKTKRYVLQTIKQILNKAIDNDLLNKNVASGVPMPKHKPKENKVLPNDIVKQIGVLAQNDIDFFMFQFLIFTGIRRGELVALTKDDIDFENKTISINKSIYYSNNKAILKGTKTNENRQIPIFDILLDKLYTLTRDSPYILFSCDGNMLSASTLRAKLKKATKTLGYSFTYHQCRHTFITNCYKAGIDVKQVQKWSGHKDIKVLLNIYTHLDNEMEEHSITLFNKWCR